MGYAASNDDGLIGNGLTAYTAALTALKNSGPRPPMPPSLDRAVRDLDTEIRAAGATPIFVSRVVR